MKLVFATNNAHKLSEVRQAVSQQIQVLSLDEIGFEGEIPETQPTIEGNSEQKVNYIYERFQIPSFADDTGLIIDALNGAPGVYSARYAGPNCSFDDNCQLVLKNLEGSTNRNARFKTVISFYDGKVLEQFEGIVEGEILDHYAGEGGFGYDPIFKPKGFDKSFAEMSMELKNSISHRGLATNKLLAFLESYRP